MPKWCWFCLVSSFHYVTLWNKSGHLKTLYWLTSTPGSLAWEGPRCLFGDRSSFVYLCPSSSVEQEVLQQRTPLKPSLWQLLIKLPLNAKTGMWQQCNWRCSAQPKEPPWLPNLSQTRQNCISYDATIMREWWDSLLFLWQLFLPQLNEAHYSYGDQM